MLTATERGRSLQVDLPSTRSKSNIDYTGPILKKKFGGRQSSDLLQTAINQNYQSGLTRSISAHGALGNNELSKNIPMVVENQLQRPQFKRWNSYNKPSEKTKKTTEDGLVASDNSISPLTVLKDQYDTRRPTINSPIMYDKQLNSTPTTISSGNGLCADTDNSYKSLECKTKNSSKEISSSKGGLYDKMITFVSSGVGINSLLSNEIEREKESSDNDTASEEDQEVQYPLDPSENKNSFKEIKMEIDKFQDNFIKKIQPTQNLDLNRTQRKLVDYRDLVEKDPNHDGNVRYSINNNYQWKIQNETIINQFDLIRFRFSSFENKKQKKVENTIGVFGYIKRYGNKIENKSISDKPTSEQKDVILRRIWDEAYNELFHVSECCENDEKSMLEIAKSVKLN